MLIKDICIYAPGDLNKIGKEGTTSWDSFSYAIQMGHNVWHHINAVQEANRQYDSGLCPRMLVQEKFDRVFFKDAVEKIFLAGTLEEAYKLIDEYDKFWVDIPGTRGLTGKRTRNAHTKYEEFFTEDSTEEVDVTDDDSYTEDQIHNLEILEEEQDK